MIYHVLNGDALLDRFKSTHISGSTIITRECLIEGDLSGDTLEDFYVTRSNFLSSFEDTPASKYFMLTVREFDKITKSTQPSEFNLWFGYDLFCQANLWFVLLLLNEVNIVHTVHLVYPYHLDPKDRWADFGDATSQDLEFCYSKKSTLSKQDLSYGSKLWQAFKYRKLDLLKQLSLEPQSINPYLVEVVEAHLDRSPQGTLRADRIENSKK